MSERKSREDMIFETLCKATDRISKVVKDAENGIPLSYEKIKNRFVIPRSSWLVPVFIGCDIQENGITIMKTSSVGKTEVMTDFIIDTPRELMESRPDLLTEDWEKMWNDLRPSEIDKKKNKQKLNTYMDWLKGRYEL